MSRFWKKERLVTGLTVFLLLFGFLVSAYAETDVTSQLVLTKGRLLFDRSNNTSYLDISISNTSPAVFLTPLKIVVTNITPASVTVNNATGQTETGAAYFSLGTDRLSDGQLDQGDTISALKIAFNNSSSLRFTFDVKVMALLPTPAATVERMTQALENKNKNDFYVNLSASEKEFFEKKFDAISDGAFNYLSQFINSATLVEEIGHYRKYETQITLPTGEVVKTDFIMVFENGAWRLSEL